jgi:hypothetical protein
MEIFEQTCVGRDGHAVTLLWADLPQEADADDGGLAELSAPHFLMRSRRK